MGFWIMNFLDIFLVSLSMSVDAMTVNATNGIKNEKIKKYKLVLIGLTFGIFQFVMPLIGYFIAYGFKQYLDKIKTAIPWIAFALLMFLAINSFVEFIKERKNKDEDLKKEENSNISLWTIFTQAIATSIDALCIGFVYCTSTIPNALIIFTCIGITTFILSTLTGLFANKLAGILEKWASLIASIVFVIVAVKILLEGLGII